MTRRRGSQASWNLRRRYFEAKDDPDAMRRLIEEGRCDHHPADAGDRDRQGVANVGGMTCR
jgi:hypothetical protein